MMSRPRVIVFDAYGTLLDIQSVLEEAKLAIGPAAADVVDLWRTKQLEYSWLRTMMGTYADFEQISRDALTYALATHSATIADHARQRLLDLWFRPRPFPDVPQVLSTLQRAGLTLAILSNGSREMLNLALEHSRLADMFAEVMSVDDVHRFKPDPAVYALARERLTLNRVRPSSSRRTDSTWPAPRRSGSWSAGSIVARARSTNWASGPTTRSPRCANC